MLKRFKHFLKNFNEKIQQIVELTKTAITIAKALNSEFLKNEAMMSFISQTYGSLNLIFLGLMVNKITEGNKEQAVFFLVAILVNFLLTQSIQNYYNYKVDFLYTFRDLEVNKFLLKKVARIPVKYRSTTEYKEIEKNANVHLVFRFYTSFIQLCSKIYGTIFTLSALTIIQPKVLIGAAFIGVIAAYFDSRGKLKSFESRKEKNYYYNLGYSLVDNFKIRYIEKLNDNVKVNNNLVFLEKAYDKYIETYKEWFHNFNREVKGKEIISKSILDLGTAGALGTAYMYGVNGLIPVGNILIFGSAYKNLIDTIRDFSGNLGVILESYLNVKAVSDLINFPIPETEYKQIPNPHHIEIEFHNVSFSYPGTKNQVLDNVSFTFSKGDKLGIIGENGAGKSTVIKLLFRIYTPTSGTILINGIDINDIADEDYYKIFSILSQDSIPEEVITVEDIIYLGDTSEPKNHKKILDSAKLSTVDKDIKHLENGYKQLLADKESVSIYNKYSSKKYTSLSGGQYRKLLLAKVFYGQKPIVVLDEPTDSIDAHSAYTIFKNLNSLKNNQIVLFVTHDIQRMQLVANKILTLKGGKVVEFDKTENLLKKKDSYFYSALETYIKTIRE